MPIYSNNRRIIWQTWLAAILWNAFTWLAIVLGHDKLWEAAQAQPMLFAFALFPLFGLLVLFSAIRGTISIRKFGDTVLIPNASGHGVAAYILLPESLNTPTPARVSLICFRNYVYQSTDGSEYRKEALWQDENTCLPKLSGNRQRIDFRFHPPAHLPVTGKRGDESYQWEIRLHIPRPGINCNVNFDLPVVASMLDNVTATEYPDDGPSYAHAVTNIPSIENTPTGLRFNYSAGRARGPALAFILLSMFISGLVLLMFQGLQHTLILTFWLVLVITLSLMLALFLIGVYLAFNTVSIEIGPTGLRKTLKIFRYQLMEQVAIADIVDIDVRNSGSSNYGNHSRVYYSLKLICRNRPDLEVGDSIENYSTAQQIRLQMLTALGENQQWEETTQRPDSSRKFPIPPWLQKLSRFGKLIKYAFYVALVYDIGHGLLAFTS